MSQKSIYDNYTLTIHEAGFNSLLQRATSEYDPVSLQNMQMDRQMLSGFTTDVNLDETIKASLNLTLSGSIYTGTTTVKYKYQGRTIPPLIFGFVTTGTAPSDRTSLLPYYDAVPDTISGDSMDINNFSFIVPNLTGIQINATSTNSSILTWNYIIYVLKNKAGKR